MNNKWPKIRCYCIKCKLLRIVKPLYETTKAEREQIKLEYICSDCDNSADPGIPMVQSCA